MKINLNGKQMDSQSKTLMALIREQSFDPDGLIAEVNFEIIKQNAWQDISIKEGDHIELLSLVGGG